MAGKKGRSGRKKGSLNRIYHSDGSFTIRYYDNDERKVKTGATVTPEEYRTIKKLERQANIKRQERIEELKRNAPQGYKNYKDFGVETDFFYRKKKTALGQSSHFRSTKAKERYFQSLERVVSGRWIQEKKTQYFRNYKKSFANVFGENSQEYKILSRKMNRMGIQKFAKMVENDEVQSINQFDSKNQDNLDERFEEIAGELGIDLEKYGY